MLAPRLPLPARSWVFQRTRRFLDLGRCRSVLGATAAPAVAPQSVSTFHSLLRAAPQAYNSMPVLTQAALVHGRPRHPCASRPASAANPRVATLSSGCGHVGSAGLSKALVVRWVSQLLEMYFRLLKWSVVTTLTMGEQKEC